MSMKFFLGSSFVKKEPVIHTGEISGYLAVENKGQLPAQNVYLYNSAGVLVETMTTDQAGFFFTQQRHPYGDYEIRVSGRVDYNCAPLYDKEVSISLYSDTIDVGYIMLQEATFGLKIKLPYETLTEATSRQLSAHLITKSGEDVYRGHIEAMDGNLLYYEFREGSTVHYARTSDIIDIFDLIKNNEQYIYFIERESESAPDFYVNDLKVRLIAAKAWTGMEPLQESVTPPVGTATYWEVFRYSPTTGFAFTNKLTNIRPSFDEDFSLIYEFRDAEPGASESYYEIRDHVGGTSGSLIYLNIPDHYNDGEHGNAPVTKIWHDALCNIPLLKSVSIPSTVTYIEPGVCNGSASVELFIVSEDNPRYIASEIDTVGYGNHLIDGGKGELVVGGANTGSVDSAAELIDTIGYEAFYGRHLLNTFEIDPFIQGISMSAFRDTDVRHIRFRAGNWQLAAIPDSFCKGSTVEEVTLPAGSISAIRYEAFCDCEDLETIFIPKSVTLIEEDAFYNTPNLARIYYSGSESDRENIIIEDGNETLLNAEWIYNYNRD